MDEKGEWVDGGGIHETRAKRSPKREQPAIGGPRRGRFGRVLTRDRGGGRGFGGPLGRPSEQARGEQGRLYGWLRAGRGAETPIAGEAVAGRGRVGMLRRFRDIARFGFGGDRRGRARYLEERGLSRPPGPPGEEEQT